MSNDTTVWAWQCDLKDIARIVVAADDEGCLQVTSCLRDGREIPGRFRYMTDLAAMVDDPTFSGEITFAPGDEGLHLALEAERTHVPLH